MLVKLILQKLGQFQTLRYLNYSRRNILTNVHNEDEEITHDDE